MEHPSFLCPCNSRANILKKKVANFLHLSLFRGGKFYTLYFHLGQHYKVYYRPSSYKHTESLGQ